MTTYTVINADQYDADSYTDVALWSAVVNNVLAIQEGDASASGVRIQVAGLDDSIMPWILIADEVAPNAIDLDIEGLDFTSYDRYKIEIDNLHMGTDGASLTMEVGTGVGPTYQTSGYEGFSQGADDADSAFTFQGIGTSSIRLNPTNTIGTAAGESFSSTIIFSIPGSAADDKRFQFNSIWTNTTNQMCGGNGWATWETITAITALRFSASAGFLVTGAFRVFAMRKP